MPRCFPPLFVLCAALALAGCGRTPSASAPTGTGDPDGGPAVVDRRFEGVLKEAVADYQVHGWVDDILRWAPGLCRLPMVRVSESRSTDLGTHGRKLYWLFAQDREAYGASAQGQPQPVGQILVKEAWGVRKATDAEVANAAKLFPTPRPGVSDRFRTPVRLTVERDGVHWTPDQKQALYVMLKLGPDAEGTDGGWVYGTLTPDGQTVTSAGRVASCLRCHEQAKHDRMLGPEPQ